MADWEEIKRLAADFQRTQTSDTLQRISERNCIDIVKKLTDLKLIDLIYTCDGKEFLTPSHLLKEIEDEIYVNGGRMHLHDLASNLNVDYRHVENTTRDLANEKSDEYSVILGQIIHSTYKTTLGKQISDCMLINGQLGIADFAKTLDLPSEFLLSLTQEILPKVMTDFVVGQDGRTFYTTDMIDKYKSIIAGALSAITRPTSIASVMKRLDITERTFSSIVDELIKQGRIDGLIENRLYIPSVHARVQNDYINSFYSSNSYISYDVLVRMDIKQPKTFLKKRFPDCMQLKSCVVGPSILSLVESLIEESIETNSYINISTNYLPSAIGSEDIELLLQDIFKKNKHFKSSAMIFNKTNVCSLGYIATCKESFFDLMRTKAQEDLKSGNLINHFLGGKVSAPLSKAPQPKVQQAEKPAEISAKKDDEKPVKGCEDLPLDDGESKDMVDKTDDSTIDSGKKDRRNKKSNKAQMVEKDDELDDELDGKKSKSRKSGGGTQGREIKQKAVKKKYIPTNKSNKSKDQDQSDEESAPKAARSNKGRAARRAMSPERDIVKTKNAQSSKAVDQKEPLIFMNTDEIKEKLKAESRSSDELTEEFYQLIADSIETELNSIYKIMAKQILDDFLKSKSEENPGIAEDTEVDIVE